MRTLTYIALYAVLFLLDLGICLTLGAHWKTTRRYSINKLKQNFKKA